MPESGTETPEETIQKSFFLGLPQEALEPAHTVDPWLSAHLAEMMEPLELIPSAITE